MRITSRRARLLAGGALALVLVTAAAARTPRAAGPACQLTGIDRVVAVGDVHGAYDRFVEILRASRLVDDRLRWIGGRAHLVQVGDVVDRGPDSLKALDLLDRLQKDASRAGGAVHVLLGNHEVMRMLGDLRYTTPGEYEAFTTSKSALSANQITNLIRWARAAWARLESLALPLPSRTQFITRPANACAISRLHPIN